MVLICGEGLGKEDNMRAGEEGERLRNLQFYFGSKPHFAYLAQ